MTRRQFAASQGGAKSGPASKFLEQLSGDARDALITGGTRRDVRARGEIFGTKEARTQAGILLHGLARLYLTAADGRELTVRYADQGALVGFVTMPSNVVRIRAVTDCSVLDFAPDSLSDLLAHDQTVARALAGEIGRRLASVVDLLASRAFAPVEQRLAAWLIDLDDAQAEVPRRAHVIRTTQQALADDLGTRREVINRLLHRFERDELVALGVARITILDPDGLRTLGGRG